MNELDLLEAKKIILMEKDDCLVELMVEMKEHNEKLKEDSEKINFEKLMFEIQCQNIRNWAAKNEWTDKETFSKTYEAIEKKSEELMEKYDELSGRMDHIESLLFEIEAHQGLINVLKTDIFCNEF